MQLWSQTAKKLRADLFLPNAFFSFLMYLFFMPSSMSTWTLTPRRWAAISLSVTLRMSNRYIAIRI